MIKKYDKLIRDKIPEIIESSGKTCKTRILSDEEYKKYLNIKIQEELKEYLEEYSLEELADLQEVINAIVKANGMTLEEFNSLREKKANGNGAFEKKLLLEEVSDKE